MLAAIFYIILSLAPVVNDRMFKTFSVSKRRSHRHAHLPSRCGGRQRDELLETAVARPNARDRKGAALHHADRHNEAFDDEVNKASCSLVRARILLLQGRPSLAVDAVLQAQYLWRTKPECKNGSAGTGLEWAQSSVQLAQCLVAEGDEGEARRVLRLVVAHLHAGVRSCTQLYAVARNYALPRAATHGSLSHTLACAYSSKTHITTHPQRDARHHEEPLHRGVAPATSEGRARGRDQSRGCDCGGRGCL